MARSRVIKPGFFLNEDLAACEPLARLLWIGLWTISDCDGLVEDRPARIKASCLPYDDCDVEKLLNQLHDQKFIVRYKSADGSKRVIYTPKFALHQHVHSNEPSSGLPRLCEESELIRTNPDKSGQSSTTLTLTLTPIPTLKEPQPLSGACVYCGVLQSQVRIAFEPDHFIPLSAGGSDDPSNMVPACHTCNQIKGARIFSTIEEARKFIHERLWTKNRARYEAPRKICFGGIPPSDFVVNGNGFVETFPEELNTEEFKAAWERWKQYNRERKRKLAPSTITAQLKKLAKMGHDGAIESIENSIANNWIGLFEPKVGTNGHSETLEERARRLFGDD